MAVAHTLSLHNISKYYGKLAAVDDVSMTIERGQFLTLLGPSGSGKTTVLMSIAGFVEPSAGEIRVDGRPITHLPPEKRNFGMVFQGYALFPHLTVADNVAFPLTVRGRPAAEKAEKVKAALDLVQLGTLADRLPRQLSGGQQQRVALARALVFEPDILLLDEPLSALDKKLRAGLQWELRALHRRVGTTFIYVTHDQEEALSMSDEIAIIRNGKIVQKGKPRELYDRPVSHFIADFLGESNFLAAEAGEASGDGFAYRAGGSSFRQAGARPAEARVLVALRPAKIRISTAEPTDAVNRIAGTIKSWSYRGNEFHFLVGTALGDMNVSQPTWRARVEPEEGLGVWLAWDPDASVVQRELV
ncbi:MAG: ABC transporter ATP-binding protein [Alphaproteobacteria bacterium]|nr:ABC transporter ATP-binding protein [Alphaproteobacteria bacterium]